MSIAFDETALKVNRKLKARNFGTIFDFVPVLLMGVAGVLFKLHTAAITASEQSDSSEALVCSWS